MSLSPRYIAVRTYSEVFPDWPKDSLQFVRKYPTELLLQRLSRINAILFQQQDISDHTRTIFEDLFPGEDYSIFLMVVSQQPRAYFSSAAIVLLIRDCLENFSKGASGQIIYKNDFGRDLFKTILIYNQIHFKSRLDIKLDSFEGVFRMDILQQNYIRSPLHQKTFAIIRFAFVAKYLSEAHELGQACKDFCKHYQVGNPWLFGKFFLEILYAGSKKENIGNNMLDFDGMPRKIIDEFTIDPTHLKKSMSLSVNMHLIPRPFYRLNNRVLILDYNFFQYLVDQGVFFLIYQCSSLRSSKQFPNYETFKGHIGYHYFEQFLVKKYLSAIFWRKSQCIVNTDHYGDFIIKSSGKRVLVIEVKSTSVHARTLEKMDFDDFKSVIDENFLSEKSATTRNKGASQILKQIKYLSTERSDLRKRLGLRDSDRLEIYPVILYTDTNFDISGANQYVNLHFADMISESSSENQKVRPITMINVSVFIDFFAQLRGASSRLTDLISDYHAFIQNNKRRYHKNKHTHHYYLSAKSFATYLKDKFPKDHLIENLNEMQKHFDLDIAPVD